MADKFLTIEEIKNHNCICSDIHCFTSSDYDNTIPFVIEDFNVIDGIYCYSNNVVIISN